MSLNVQFGEEYDEANRKAFILMCGHSLCSECIKLYVDAQ